MEACMRASMHTLGIYAGMQALMRTHACMYIICVLEPGLFQLCEIGQSLQNAWQLAAEVLLF